MTMSLLKLLPTETILNTLTEVDVLFPVPIHPYHDVHPRKKREIERNIVYTGLKDAYERYFLYRPYYVLRLNLNPLFSIIEDLRILN